MDNYKLFDNLDTTKYDKIINRLIIIFGILIIFIFVNIWLLTFCNINLADEVIYKYNCSTVEQQIENSNKGILNYYTTCVCDLYDSVIISPLCVQCSIYNYEDSINSRSPRLFSYFDNGFKSWSESGRIFEYPCFSSINPGVVDTNETLIGKSYDISDGFLNTLGSDMKFDLNTLYSIFHLEYGLKDGVYNTKDDIIYYQGNIGYKKTDSYEAVKVPLSNDKYSVYFIDGNLNKFDSSNFIDKVALVEVDSFTWQSYGKVNNLASSFSYNDTDVVILNQFGFSENNHTVVNSFESDLKDKYFFVAEYSVIIVDEDTGLILAIGKHK